MHACDSVSRARLCFADVCTSCRADGRAPRQISEIVDVVGRFFWAYPSCCFGFHSESAELNAEGVKISL